MYRYVDITLLFIFQFKKYESKQKLIDCYLLFKTYYYFFNSKFENRSAGCSRLGVECRFKYRLKLRVCLSVGIWFSKGSTACLTHCTACVIYIKAAETNLTTGSDVCHLPKRTRRSVTIPRPRRSIIVIVRPRSSGGAT